MTKWFQWIVLTSITGNPLVSILILLAFWWAADRYTLGVLPDPVQPIRRFFRRGKLQRVLGHNPHDRRARLELASLWVQARQYKKAIPLLKPNLEAGDSDAQTLFVMGIACLGAGHVEQGETFLEEANEADPNFRMGEVFLERGRWRLRRGDARGAVESLKAFCTIRPGTIEGQTLLAHAQLKSGDDVAAAYARQTAWNNYVHSPGFQRRRERWWAWRARPSRPLTYLAIAALGGFILANVAGPSLQNMVESSAQPVAEEWDP